MEITYEISERDYVVASKMAAKGWALRSWKTLVFWAVVLLCLILLPIIVPANHREAETGQRPHVEANAAPLSNADAARILLFQIGPLFVIAAMWVYVLKFAPAHMAKRRYRLEIESHGEMTAAFDPESFEIHSSLGSTQKFGWHLVSDWIEKEDIIVLRFPTTTFYIVSTKGLSEAQREELRGILGTALPKKRR